MKKTLFLLLLAVSFIPASAQLTRWQAGTGYLEIGKRVSITEDKDGTLPIDYVSRFASDGQGSSDSLRFLRNTKTILHFGFNNRERLIRGTFWGLCFTITNGYQK